MKKMLMIFCICVCECVHAAEPTISCPSGYKAVPTTGFEVKYATCPSGYIVVDTVKSCLEISPGGMCIMFTPENTEYSDDTGTYVFEEACVME